MYSNCLKVHRLVSFKSFEFSISKWSHSKQRIEEDELFKTQNFSELKNKEILANLKQLAICYNCFDLNILNNFCQLVHLEIFLENSKEGSVWKLKLPKLKILVLHPVHRFENEPGHAHLSIDCPLLSVLLYDELETENRLDLNHPQTIKKLETNTSGSKLDRFKNLECLVTSEFKIIIRGTLVILPKLKELYFNKTIRCAQQDGVERMKQSLTQFLAAVQELRTPDSFKFSFAGFHLTKTMLEQIDFGEEPICFLTSSSTARTIGCSIQMFA